MTYGAAGRRHRPDSGVRTRMRRHSSQRTTSSGAAARMALSSAMDRLDLAALAAAAAAASPRRPRTARAASRRAPSRSAGMLAGDLGALGPHLAGSLSISAKAASRRPRRSREGGGELVALGGELGAPGVGRLAALHDLQHDLLEVALPPLERGDLGLEARQVPRRGRPGRSRGAAGRGRRGCGPASTSPSALACSRARSPASVSAAITWVASRASARRARRSRPARAGCGGGAPACRSRSRARPDRADASGLPGAAFTDPYPRRTVGGGQPSTRR